MHPDVGRLVLAQTALTLSGPADARLILYTPEPATDTGERLRRLTTEAAS